jgi:hypothetical protein
MLYCPEFLTLSLNKDYKYAVQENKESTVYIFFLSSIVDIFPVERLRDVQKIGLVLALNLIFCFRKLNCSLFCAYDNTLHNNLQSPVMLYVVKQVVFMLSFITDITVLLHIITKI